MSLAVNSNTLHNTTCAIYETGTEHLSSQTVFSTGIYDLKYSVQFRVYRCLSFKSLHSSTGIWTELN